MRVRKRLKRGGLSPARLEITCDDRSSRRSSDACAADSAGAGVSIVGLAVICIGDRKSVVEGKRVDLGGGRIIKKKKKRLLFALGAVCVVLVSLSHVEWSGHVVVADIQCTVDFAYCLRSCDISHSVSFVLVLEIW